MLLSTNENHKVWLKLAQIDSMSVCPYYYTYIPNHSVLEHAYIYIHIETGSWRNTLILTQKCRSLLQKRDVASERETDGERARERDSATLIAAQVLEDLCDGVCADRSACASILSANRFSTPHTLNRRKV